MDTTLGIIIPTEVSRKEKDKYHIISLTCGIFKNGANGFYLQTETDSRTYKTKLRSKERRGRIMEEIGIKKIMLGIGARHFISSPQHVLPLLFPFLTYFLKYVSASLHKHAEVYVHETNECVNK